MRGLFFGIAIWRLDGTICIMALREYGILQVAASVYQKFILHELCPVRVRCGIHAHEGADGLSDETTAYC